MIIFDSKELEQHGITHQSASQLVFKGRIFTKKETFAARLRHLAVELAEENLRMGKPCIIVDCQSHITLWRAEQSPIGIKTHPQATHQSKLQQQRTRSRTVAKAS